TAFLQTAVEPVDGDLESLCAKRRRAIRRRHRCGFRGFFGNLRRGGDDLAHWMVSKGMGVGPPDASTGLRGFSRFNITRTFPVAGDGPGPTWNPAFAWRRPSPRLRARPER